MTKIEPAQNKSAAISADIDTFIAEMTKSSAPRSSGTGRLIFALDATASRNDTWDMACHLQGDMFKIVASIGGLNVQLVYYRDLSECRSSRWVTDTSGLTRLMTRIQCRAGRTQIGKVLAHAKRETALLKVSALSSSAMPVRKTTTSSFPRPTNWGRPECRSLCSRKVIIVRSNTRSGRSRV